MDRGWLLPCQAMEWVDREWPGWIRVQLVDADGREWFLADKVPIFDVDFGPEAAMPAPIRVACDIVGQEDDRVVVEPRWGVEAEDGTTRFVVQIDRLQPADN